MSDALKWGCVQCTFLNPANDTKCIMCNAERPLDTYRTMQEIEEQQRQASGQEQDTLADVSMKEMDRTQTGASNWSEGDFGDDGEEWDDDDAEVKGDSDGDDGWGDPDDLMGADDAIAHEVKIPEKSDAKNWKVLGPREIREYQVQVLKNIAEVLFIESLDEAAIIMRKFRWNKAQVMEEYPVDPEAVRENCGLVSKSAVSNDTGGEEEFDCFLCVMTVPISQTYELGCGHRFCHDCWNSYLTAEMEKGPRVVDTRCIEPKCGLIVRPEAFERFLEYKWKAKYQEYLTHSFVQYTKNLQWCPGKDCQYAARADFGSICTIECKCQHVWCFACRVNAHAPCSCELTEKWLKLCSTDSENVTWIRAFTKMCPKCKNQIEKNQGCNHMTCRCGYEFCWLCKKDWRKTGYGHTCNKPDDIVKLEEEANKAKSHMQRYGFYFARYETHEKSLDTAAKSFQNAEETVRDFILARPDLKYHDLEFITDAIHEVMLTKRVLQWSYCYGYYLKDKTTQKELFQTQQGLLESFADQLHEKAEKRVDTPEARQELMDIAVRSELINLTQTVRKYRNNLNEALEVAEFIFEDGLA